MNPLLFCSSHPKITVLTVIFISALLIYIKKRRHDRQTTALYFSWEFAREKRVAWRYNHQKIPNYFLDPHYQELWDIEIGLEAELIMLGLKTEETSLRSFR